MMTFTTQSVSVCVRMLPRTTFFQYHVELIGAVAGLDDQAEVVGAVMGTGSSMTRSNNLAIRLEFGMKSRHRLANSSIREYHHVVIYSNTLDLTDTSCAVNT